MSGARTKPGPAKKALGILTALVLVALAAYFGPMNDGPKTSAGEGAVRSPAVAPAHASRELDPALRRAISEEQSGVMVTFTAAVTRLLPDDNDGSRHQRFIMELPERIGDVRTILVAHNIDLAKRIPLEEGDEVTVRGQYEWNEKGGVIHWTHHDPGGFREGGWIDHEGDRYE